MICLQQMFLPCAQLWARLSPRSDRGNLYYKSEVLECICECFPPGDGTYGNNAYLDLDKQLPFLYNHPWLVGVEAGTSCNRSYNLSPLTLRKPMQKQMGWKAVLNVRLGIANSLSFLICTRHL